jgi:hypothetical protein
MTSRTSVPAAHASAWDAAVEPNRHRMSFPVHQGRTERADQGRYRPQRAPADAGQRVAGITHPISVAAHTDHPPSRMSRFLLGTRATSTPGRDAISGSTAGNLQRGAG